MITHFEDICKQLCRNAIEFEWQDILGKICQLPAHHSYLIIMQMVSIESIKLSPSTNSPGGLTLRHLICELFLSILWIASELH